MVETAEEMHERIFNPSPVITHCPCGFSLEKCLSMSIANEECRTFLDDHYDEFLKTVPERYLRALADSETPK